MKRRSFDPEFKLAAVRLVTEGGRRLRDRGTPSTSLEYGALLAARGIRGSMSRPGDCWDNAVAESVFATLKRELLHRAHWTTRAAATQALTDYIEGWYNRFRGHSSLDYLSPMQFEHKLASVA